MSAYLTYFDEIKPDRKGGREWYLVGGLVVPFALVSDIEDQMNALAQEFFGHSEMTPATEFHAADIYSGKGAYKGWPSERRIELLTRLAAILGAAVEGETGKVWACIHVDKLRTNTDPAKAAFAYFCERVQSFIGKGGRTLLIGDLDGEESRRMIRDFSRYRANGRTPWDYGAPIPSIMDAVHFAHSHHSRLLQLADVFLFFSSLQWGGKKDNWMRKSAIKAREGLDLFPNRYKDWPKS